LPEIYAYDCFKLKIFKKLLLKLFKNESIHKASV